MAKNTFLDWSTTASSNTDIAGIGILGTNAVNNFDDALRTMMAQLRRDLDGKIVYTTNSGNYTAVANDNNAFLRFSASATLTLTAAATLGANWHVFVVANGGDVVIDPNASETIDGRTTLTVRDGSACLVICDGTNFRTNQAADQRVPKGHIFGLTTATNATDATNDIDIATGECASDGTIPYLMVLGTALTKRLDASWAVGTGNGGLDTGAVANGAYYVWLIQRSDTGVVDALFSLSSTSPTMPTNYDRKRRIGSLIRASAVNRAFYQDGDIFLYKASLLAINVTNPGTSAVVGNISTPSGATKEVMFTATIQNTSSSNFRTGALFSSPNQNDEAPNETTNPLTSLSAALNAAGGIFNPSGNFRIPTDSTGQIRYRVLNSDASVKLIISTHGWVDTRGRG